MPGATCIGSDAQLMLPECLSRVVSPILNLDAADVMSAADSWTAIHTACMEITDPVCTARSDVVLVQLPGIACVDNMIEVVRLVTLHQVS